MAFKVSKKCNGCNHLVWHNTNDYSRHDLPRMTPYHTCKLFPDCQYKHTTIEVDYTDTFTPEETGENEE